MHRTRVALLISVLLVAAGCGSTPAVPTSPSGLGLTNETPHFLISYSAADSACIAAVVQVLESNRERICADLHYGLDFKVVIGIYPDIAALHRAIGAPDAPNWVAGLTILSGEIKMVSPLNPGPVHSYGSIMLGLVHEFTHAVVIRGLGATRLPPWLQEGIATYEAGGTWTYGTIGLSGAQRAAIAPYVDSNHIPSFSQLSSGGPVSFEGLGGFLWSYTIVEFAATRFGRGALRDWIDRGGDFESTFGVTEEAFRSAWIEYLKAHYGSAHAAVTGG